MKIIVYGMGLIGASMAAALKAAGHAVFGKNRSRGPVDVALARGMIDGAAETYDGAEAVILALPPAATMKELDEGEFPEGALVMDVCGVKKAVEEVVWRKKRRYRYLGLHPMAGKETSGVDSADGALFKGKNLVVTYCGETDEGAIAQAEALARDIGFGRIVRCTAEEHDKKIALTSQLAHVVSNAYIKSPRARDVVGFTGGSFQDMTRVGGVDVSLWTELYLLNRENLAAEIGELAERLTSYAAAIKEGDGARLAALLEEGRAAYLRYFSEK